MTNTTEAPAPDFASMTAGARVRFVPAPGAPAIEGELIRAPKLRHSGTGYLLSIRTLEPTPRTFMRNSEDVEPVPAADDTLLSTASLTGAREYLRPDGTTYVLCKCGHVAASRSAHGQHWTTRPYCTAPQRYHGPTCSHPHNLPYNDECAVWWLRGTPEWRAAHTNLAAQ